MTIQSTTLIDLSHTVEEGMVTYKGLPAPVICDFLSREASRDVYAPGTEFHIGKIEMVGNSGTYVDAPFVTDDRIVSCPHYKHLGPWMKEVIKQAKGT